MSIVVERKEPAAVPQPVRDKSPAASGGAPSERDLRLDLFRGIALWLMFRRPAWALAASLGLYGARWWFDWNLPAYPSGEWVFNPFAWQLLFVLGAWLGLGGAERARPLIRSRGVVALALLYLLFAFAV